jgi:hypothetical protein
VTGDDRCYCICGVPTSTSGEYCPRCEPRDKSVACLVCEAETHDTCICEAQR